MNTEKLRELHADMLAFGGANAAYIDRLAALIAEEDAREPVAWRPIETCPNEQDVLIAYDDGSVVFTSADENDYEWGPYRQNAKGRISGIARAQHWMPLPQPPSAGGEK